jgi:lysozyme family protein
MASFDLFLPTLLKHEGGYVDDPEDPGGETNKGVTMDTFCSCSTNSWAWTPLRKI